MNSLRRWHSFYVLGVILAVSIPLPGRADSGLGGWSGSRPGWSGGYDPAWFANQDRRGGHSRWGGHDSWSGSDWNLGRYGEWSGGRGSDWNSRWDRGRWNGDPRLGSDWRSDGSWWRGGYGPSSDRVWWHDRDRFDNSDRSVMRPPRIIRVDPNRPIYVRPDSRVIIIEPNR